MDSSNRLAITERILLIGTDLVFNADVCLMGWAEEGCSPKGESSLWPPVFTSPDKSFLVILPIGPEPFICERSIPCSRAIFWPVAMLKFYHMNHPDLANSLCLVWSAISWQQGNRFFQDRMMHH